MTGKARLGYVLLAVWALVGVVAIGTLAVNHTVALPAPREEDRLATEALKLRRYAGRPFLVHVIPAGCSCTGTLFKHLIARGPFHDAEEHVLFVGEDPVQQRAATARGFAFTTVTGQEMADRFGLDSGPVLLLFGRMGELRYAGGYFDRPEALVPLDERLYTQSRPTPLPIFGCAISPALRRRVDPLGIVY